MQSIAPLLSYKSLPSFHATVLNELLFPRGGTWDNFWWRDTLHMSHPAWAHSSLLPPPLAGTLV